MATSLPSTPRRHRQPRLDPPRHARRRARPRLPVGSITGGFATGVEPFTDLGSIGTVHPDPGKVILVDCNDVVSARRWRQSAQSATSATTVDALVVVEGHHDTASGDVEAALTDLTSLLAAYQPGGQSRSYVLSPTSRRVGTGEDVESASR
jgi:hypothetical protein